MTDLLEGIPACFLFACPLHPLVTPNLVGTDGRRHKDTKKSASFMKLAGK